MIDKEKTNPVVLRYEDELLAEPYDVYLGGERFYFVEPLVPGALANTSDCIIIANNAEQAQRMITRCAANTHYFPDPEKLKASPLTIKRAHQTLLCWDEACLAYLVALVTFPLPPTCFCPPRGDLKSMDFAATIERYAFLKLMECGLGQTKDGSPCRQLTVADCVRGRASFVGAIKETHLATIFPVYKP